MNTYSISADLEEHLQALNEAVELSTYCVHQSWRGPHPLGDKIMDARIIQSLADRAENEATRLMRLAGTLRAAAPEPVRPTLYERYVDNLDNTRIDEDLPGELESVVEHYRTAGRREDAETVRNALDFISDVSATVDEKLAEMPDDRPLRELLDIVDVPEPEPAHA